MKRIIILISFLIISIFSFAENANLFQINEVQLQEEFAELNELENQIQQGNLPSAKHMAGQSERARLLQKRVLNSVASSENLSDIDWNSFTWGFCCCPIGFFVVAINSNRDDVEKKSYWIGVAANVILHAISTIAIVASSVSSSGGCATY